MIRKIVFLILSLTLASNAWAVSKESLVKKGNVLYKKGDFNASVKSYEDGLKVDPESAIINFNLGTALYKDKKYDEAITHLQKGLLSDDPLLKKNAHFNLGDALYAYGVDIGEKQVDQAIGALEESFRQFTEVINLDDKDKDAQYNRDIVQKQLELLKKKKQQQQNQQNQSKGQKQNKEDQSKSESQDKKAADSSSQENQSPEISSQPENKDAEDKKEEQKPEQGFSQSSDEKESSPEKKKEVDAQPKPGEMTKEEAKALLRQFEQSPEATGLINFDKRKAEETPVLKDW